MVKSLKLDGGTDPKRAAASIVAALAASWGGVAELPASARLIADQTAIVALRLAAYRRAVLAGAGSPASDRALIGLSTELRRGLELLAEMQREQKAQPSVPTIAEYIRQFDAQSETTDDERERD
jgi:hypothetical protein